MKKCDPVFVRTEDWGGWHGTPTTVASPSVRAEVAGIQRGNSVHGKMLFWGWRQLTGARLSRGPCAQPPGWGRPRPHMAPAPPGTVSLGWCSAMVAGASRVSLLSNGTPGSGEEKKQKFVGRVFLPLRF